MRLGYNRTLSNGAASHSFVLLQGDADRHLWGRARLAYIRTLQSLGRWPEAWNILGVSKTGKWTPLGHNNKRAPVWQAAADHFLQRSDEFAAGRSVLLQRPCGSGGSWVAIDRCLLLIAECAFEQGDSAQLASARRLWWGWREEPYSFQAGLLLARLMLSQGDERGLMFWQSCLCRAIEFTSRVRIADRFDVSGI